MYACTVMACAFSALRTRGKFVECAHMFGSWSSARPPDLNQNPQFWCTHKKTPLFISRAAVFASLNFNLYMTPFGALLGVNQFDRVDLIMGDLLLRCSSSDLMPSRLEMYAKSLPPGRKNLPYLLPWKDLLTLGLDSEWKLPWQHRPFCQKWYIPCPFFVCAISDDVTRLGGQIFSSSVIDRGSAGLLPSV